MTEMTKGGNVPLTSSMLRAVLYWSGGPDVPDVDASAILLAANGRVASDDDFVFYNQPTHPSGAVQHAGKSTDAAAYDVLDVHLAALPPAVDRVVLAASADRGTFGQVPGLRLVLTDLSNSAPIAEFPMTASDETAFVCGELYRRDGGWKFRAVGQGYASGLAGLASDFGIDVGDGGADLDAEASPAPEPAGPVLPPPSFAAPTEVAAAAPVMAPAEMVTPQLVLPPPLLPPPVLAPPEPVLVPPAEPAAAAPPVWAPPAPPLAPPEPPMAPPAPQPPLEAVPPVPPVPPAPAVQAAVPIPPVPMATTATGTLTLDACPIGLERNQRVDLVSAQGGPLGRMIVNLGWVPGHGRLDIDLDASCIAFDASGKKLEIVWYQHQNEFYGALYHTGDNRTGSANGEDAERILVDLARMPDHVAALVFTINSFHGHTFTDLQRAYCTITDENGGLLVQYDLTDTQPSTAVLVGIARRTGAGHWQLRAIGEYHDHRTVKKLVDPAARHVLLD